MKEESEFWESLDRRAYLETEEAITKLLCWSPEGGAVSGRGSCSTCKSSTSSVLRERLEVAKLRDRLGSEQEPLSAAESAERQNKSAQEVMQDEAAAWNNIEERAMREIDRQVSGSHVYSPLWCFDV